MQTMVAFSLLTREVTLKSSGLISYGQSPSPARPSQIEGNQIKNDLGEIVYLRGVNRAYAIDHPSGSWGGWAQYKQSIVDLVLDRMKYCGINHIRHTFAAEFWINDPSVTTEQGTMTLGKFLAICLHVLNNGVCTLSYALGQFTTTGHLAKAIIWLIRHTRVSLTPNAQSLI